MDHLLVKRLGLAVHLSLAKEVELDYRYLLVEGLALPTAPGARLRIGTVELLVTGETEPCSRMDEVVSGLRAALTPDWRGGVTCRVVSGGEIKLGESMTMEQ